LNCTPLDSQHVHELTIVDQRQRFLQHFPAKGDIAACERLVRVGVWWTGIDDRSNRLACGEQE
jgi:hypothetical protein